MATGRGRPSSSARAPALQIDRAPLGRPERPLLRRSTANVAIYSAERWQESRYGRARSRRSSGLVGATTCRRRHLPVLVDGAGDGGVPSLEGAIRLVHPPPLAHRPPVAPGRCPEPRQEALYPAVGGAPIDREASLSQPLRDIAVPQPQAGVPAHSRGDDVVREVPAGEGAGRSAGEPPPAGASSPAQTTQPGLAVPSYRTAPAPHARHTWPVPSPMRPRSVRCPLSRDGACVREGRHTAPEQEVCRPCAPTAQPKGRHAWRAGSGPAGREDEREGDQARAPEPESPW